MPSYSVRNFWLNFHVGYACRHSGACCTAGWPIPVERDRVIPIQSLASRGDCSWLLPDANAPADVAGTLVVAPTGECVFHGVAGCGVYAARPVSCAHFPYLCLIDQRGVHVTLSHYCPTAAAMLYEDLAPIEIVEGPSPVAGFDVPEGLDARESSHGGVPVERKLEGQDAGKLGCAHGDDDFRAGRCEPGNAREAETQEVGAGVRGDDE